MFSIRCNSRVNINHEEKKEDPQRITKIRPFINTYNWEGINFPSEKDVCKKFENNNVTIALNAKKKKCILLIFQNITQIVKNKLFF